MSFVAIVDVEGAVRTWLRNRPETFAVVSTRSFFGVPNEVVYPCYIVKQVGGGLLPGEMPIHEALIQFDCFGEGTNKAQASGAMRALVGALADLKYGDQMDDETIAFGAVVQSVIFIPDPINNQARYVVTAAVSAKFSTYA